MNIEDMTIKQIRAIQAEINVLLGAPSASVPSAPTNLLGEFVGRMVVVRDHRAGVFWGHVAKVGATSLVLHAGARQGHWWHRKGAVLGLALDGPVATGQTRYTAPSEARIYLCDIIQIAETTPTADAAWASMPVWR